MELWNVTSENFKEWGLINDREEKDSITIYKTIEKIKEGIINKPFITETLKQLKKPKYSDWLIILSCSEAYTKCKKEMKTITRNKKYIQNWQLLVYSRLL